MGILKSENNAGKLPTKVWVEEKDIPLDLSKLLRSVAVTIAEAKISDDYLLVIIVQTESEGTSDFIANHLAFL